MMEQKRENLPTNKNDNALVRAANLLSDLGYDVIAVKKDEPFLKALTIIVVPPDSEKDTRK